MSNASDYDADIIVAGAGPSGLVVSCEAVLAGARVLTLDKRNGPTWARAGNLMPRPLELFASRGLIDRVMKRAWELHRDPRTTHGIWAGLPGLDYSQLETEYPYVLFLAQIETEKILADHLQSIGGDLRLGHEVLGFEETSDGVRVQVCGADGVTRILSARYLVGADGNRSVVREAAGIDWMGHPAGRYAFNVDARIPNPYPQNLTVFHSQNGWAMAYPLSDSVTRLAMIDARMGSRPHATPPTLDEALEMLRWVHGSDHGVQEVQAITQFHDAMYCAQQLRKGKVFLVGESVRVHYPASGVGMNFCIQDAFNLGWKIGGVAAGWLRDDVLDSYESERLPELAKFLDNVRRQCAIQFNFDEEHEALKRFIEEDLISQPSVNRQLCETLAGLNVRYPTAPDVHPLVGTRLPNLRLVTEGGGASRVLDALHAQCFLLLDVTGHGRCTTTRTTRLHRLAVDPADRAVLAPLESVLVRPDGHVAWAGTAEETEGGAGAELQRWLAAGAADVPAGRSP